MAKQKNAAPTTLRQKSPSSFFSSFFIMSYYSQCYPSPACGRQIISTCANTKAGNKYVDT